VIDFIIRCGTTRKSLGGAAAYSSIALKRYGVNVSVVSKVGYDFPEEYLLFLARNSIDTSHIKLSKLRSTSFRLVYEDGQRKLFLTSRCEQILPEDIPDELNYDLIHVGPVAGEVPPQTLKKLRRCEGIISLDLQGYVRDFRNGYVTYSYSDKAIEALRYVDVVHGDEDEVMALASGQGIGEAALNLLRIGPKVILVTKGEQGSYIFSRKRAFYIPAPKPRRVADPTGAGDVYTAIFAAHYTISNDVVEAAIMASSAASLLVEEPGLSGVGTYEEVERRAKSILSMVEEIEVFE